MITTEDVGKKVVIKLLKPDDLHYGEVYNNLTGILTKLYGFGECCVKLDQGSIKIVKDYNNRSGHGYVLSPRVSSRSVFIFNEKKVLSNE